MSPSKPCDRCILSNATTLLEKPAHNECQCNAIVIGNATKNHNRILFIIGYT